MFKTIASIVALAAGVALTTPAAAQTFTPPSTPVALTGTITVQQGGTFSCNLTVLIQVLPSQYANVNSRSLMPGGGQNGILCGGPVLPYGAWTLTSGPGSHVTLTFGVNTPLGMPCFGTLILPISAGTITLPSATLIPAVTPGHLNCNITSLTLNSTPTLGV